MNQLVDEMEQQKQEWKEKYAREYDRLSRNIGALESDRGEWSAKVFYELRNHLQTLDALNEKFFALLATLKDTQKRLAIAEAELAYLEQNHQPP
jgi:hypothetical protein